MRVARSGKREWRTRCAERHEVAATRAARHIQNRMEGNGKGDCVEEYGPTAAALEAARGTADTCISVSHQRRRTGHAPPVGGTECPDWNVNWAPPLSETLTQGFFSREPPSPTREGKLTSLGVMLGLMRWPSKRKRTESELSALREQNASKICGGCSGGRGR